MRTDPCARVKWHIAGTKIEAGGADVAAGRDRLDDLDRVALALGVLLDQDRVGAFGHGRAGEDAHRFARPKRTGVALARARHADHLEPRTGFRFRGAERVAVHRGSREGRLRQQRRHVLGQDASERLVERHGFGGERRHAREKLRNRLVDGKQAHLAFARQSPERPPVFSSSRISVIRIARSAALAMS